MLIFIFSVQFVIFFKNLKNAFTFDGWYYYTFTVNHFLCNQTGKVVPRVFPKNTSDLNTAVGEQ